LIKLITNAKSKVKNIFDFRFCICDQFYQSKLYFNLLKALLLFQRNKRKNKESLLYAIKAKPKRFFFKALQKVK